MTESELALIQNVKELNKSLARIANAAERFADLFQPRLGANFDSLKTDLLAEMRKIVRETQPVAKPTVDKRWFTSLDVATELNVKPATVRERCRLGLVVGEKRGKEWRIPLFELERLKRDGLPLVPKETGLCPSEEAVHSLLNSFGE